jgi:predicted phage terminase large subunit-like protein
MLKSEYTEAEEKVDLEARQAELSAGDSAENSFYKFLKQAWPHIEGDVEFIDSWHIEGLCKHLELCYAREIKRLIINVPPRSSKTTVVSVAFPAWVWLQNPQEKFMYASYASSLSTQHSLKCKRLIESPWYQNNWQSAFQLAKDQKAKSYFENNRKGYRLATSVGGSSTGVGANFLIADDPNNARDGESKLKREGTNDWWDQVWSTRLNDPKNDVMIVIQQRLHEKDVTGHILASNVDDMWDQLIIPMEFEIARRSQTYIDNKLWWEDPRTKEGELLSTGRFAKKEIDNYKNVLGSYGYAGQYQQRPSPLGGGHIKKEWFKKWDMPNPPKYDIILQSWDTAFSDKPDAAYSACTTWGIWKTYEGEGIQHIMLLSMWRGRVGYPELRERAKRLVRDYKDTGVHKNMRPAMDRVDVCLIEAKATGDPLIRDLRNANIPAIPYLPKGDKNSRVQRILPYLESGLVWLPTEQKNKDFLLPFADEFVESVSSFPNAESRDLVDTMTQALSYTRDHIHLRHPKDKYEEEVVKPRKKLY